MRQYEIARLAYIVILLTAVATNGQRLTTTNAPGAIPWSQLGAKASADYKGDGLAVTPTAFGARLRCVFQRLDGEATSDGLWLTSTVTNGINDRFRVTATELGRKSANDSQGPELNFQLAAKGSVSVNGQTVRFVRPGLTEEYSVSVDGVRQDFVVEKAPLSPPAGELVVKLAATGAKVEPAAYGARLVLENSGRKIAYSRLRVTDATGKVLPARIETSSAEGEVADSTSWSDCSFFEELSVLPAAATEVRLVVVVNDTDAVYPVRIDPTFSDANWISMGDIAGSTGGETSAAVVDASGNFYIAGGFTAVGDAVAHGIAKWNGSTWSALGTGIIDGDVFALAVSGNTLYAGGGFRMAGGAAATCIAQWNGSTWSALGSGISGIGGVVYALAVSGGTLYAGGVFTTAGGSAANNIAQWNGSAWSALGSGMNKGVSALAVSGSTLYAGGNFTTAGGSAANNIAQWNGSAWSALGSGMNKGVSALAISGSTLYAGGNFTTAGGNAANYVAQWNGNSWSALGSGMNANVDALAVSDSTLYAGGNFTTAGGSGANYIAQWNGSSWSGMGATLDSVVALAVSGSTLYVAEIFATAQWNGSSWSALGLGAGSSLGLDGDVTALAVSGSTLYVGGSFGSAGGAAADSIAQWNGSSWSTLGAVFSGYDGFAPPIAALAVSGGTLYVGGDFTSVGDDTNANYIAQWNGSSWSALGSGMDSYVYALVVSGDTLYAGGNFTSAGDDTNANYIAQWNGSSWSALGSGVSGVGSDGGGPYISALAVSGSTLYAGGNFGAAGGDTNAQSIAQWNGSSWSPLGSGVSGMGFDGGGPFVSALAVSGSTLYVGGDFGAADGDTNATCIARWDGSNWSALGAGTDGAVNALAASGGTLYAGGSFDATGDFNVQLNSIGQWDGSSWSALGSGMGGFAVSPVLALAVTGGTLYAGGAFTIAGTNVSAYVAEAILPGVPVSYMITVSASPSAGGTVSGGGTFAAGSGQTVIATPNAGYTFTNWTENGTVVSSTRNYTFTLNDNVELVANFITGSESGSLQVTITPTNAVSAGAQWQLLGTNHDSGATVSNLPVGNYLVSFTSVPGWIAAPSQTVTITNGLTVTDTGVYAETSPPTQTYTFGTESQNPATANITYDSTNDTFQYTDAANSSDDSATIPLVGAAAGLISTSNDWTAFLTPNITARTMTADSADSPHVWMYLGFYYQAPSGVHLVTFGLHQENNTGGANDENFANGYFGTAADFRARVNGNDDATTPLGTSQFIQGGSVLLLSGSNAASPGTEAINAVTADLELSYSASSNTVTGYCNGTPVGTYSLASWGSSPSLTLFVGGSSGQGIGVPAGTATASDFYIGSNTVTSAPATNWQGSDGFCSPDFSSNWTVVQMSKGDMTVVDTNCHASFLVPISITNEQNAYIGWQRTPTTGEDWMVEIVGHNSASWSASGGSSLQLAVVSTASLATSLEGYRIALERGSGGPSFNVVQWLGGNDLDRASVSTTTTDCQLRLVYDSASQQIEAWYNPSASGSSWSELDTIGLSAFSPDMSPTDTFTFAILSDTYYGPVTEGQIWAGNFSVNSLVASGSSVSIPIDTAFGFANGIFGFDVSGPSGSNVVIQVSADLKTWTSLQTNLLGSGPLHFTDAQSPTNRQRFYRAELLP